MDTIYITIPFDVQRAKRSSNGEEEGKIVTRDGKEVRIICFDLKNDKYPIIGLVKEGDKEAPETFKKNGIYAPDEKECEYDLFLSVPEWTTFKDGDVYKTESGSVAIYNGNYKAINNNTPYYVGLRECDNKLIFQSNDFGFGIISKCTLNVSEEEKQKLIDALKESKDPRAKEYLKRFFGIGVKEECELKPFDKVLVRDDDGVWFAAIFSHLRGDGQFFCAGGNLWEQCVPYEGNEHLLGTSNDLE